MIINNGDWVSREENIEKNGNGIILQEKLKFVLQGENRVEDNHNDIA